jgi:hypothetical protein
LTSPVENTPVFASQELIGTVPIKIWDRYFAFDRAVIQDLVPQGQEIGKPEYSKLYEEAMRFHMDATLSMTPPSMPRPRLSIANLPDLSLAYAADTIARPSYDWTYVDSPMASISPSSAQSINLPRGPIPSSYPAGFMVGDGSMDQNTFIPSRKRGHMQEDDELDMVDDEDIAPIDHPALSKHGLKSRNIQVTDEDEVKQFYEDIMEEILHYPIKAFLKSWIKVIEPNKQRRWPYVNSDPQKRPKSVKPTPDGNMEPPWWPENVMHKEPDHLNKLGCRALVVHLITLVQTDTSFHKPGLPNIIQLLRIATLETQNLHEQKDSHDKRRMRMFHIKQFFDVAERQFMWRQGEVCKLATYFDPSSASKILTSD